MMYVSRNKKQLQNLYNRLPSKLCTVNVNYIHMAHDKLLAGICGEGDEISGFITRGTL
jgi:hypothetical protein